MYNNKMYFKITNNFVKVEFFFTVAKCGCYLDFQKDTVHLSYFIIIIVITLVVLVCTFTLGHDILPSGFSTSFCDWTPNVCYLYVDLPYYYYFVSLFYMCVHMIFSFMVLPVSHVTTCMHFSRKLIVYVTNNLFSHWRLSNWAVKEK